MFKKINIMQRILTRREKLILYSTLGVFIFSIGFNFLIAPVLDKNQALDQQINYTEKKIKKYLRLLAVKEEIEGKFRKFSTSSKDLQSAEDATVGILSELENLAKNSNIRILDIRPRAPRRGSLYTETLIELKTEADMAGYLKFIYNIENSLLLLKVQGFRLDSKSGTQALDGNFSISQISLD